MVVIFIFVLSYLRCVLVIFIWWCLFGREFLGNLVFCVYCFVVFYDNLVVCDVCFKDLDNIIDGDLGLVIKDCKWISFFIDCEFLRDIGYVYVV